MLQVSKETTLTTGNASSSQHVSIRKCRDLKSRNAINRAARELYNSQLGEKSEHQKITTPDEHYYGYNRWAERAAIGHIEKLLKHQVRQVPRSGDHSGRRMGVAEKIEAKSEGPKDVQPVGGYRSLHLKDRRARGDCRQPGQ